MSEHAVAASKDVKEGQLLEARNGNQKVLLTRVDGTVRVCAAKCPHLGLSLAHGKVEDGTIVCPFHGSSYDLATGENRDWVNSVAGKSMPRWTHRVIAMGKKPRPLDTFEATERDGSVYLG